MTSGEGPRARAPGTPEVLAWVEGRPVLAVVDHEKGAVVAFGGGSAFAGQCLNQNYVSDADPQVPELNGKLLARIAAYLAGRRRAQRGESP